MNAKPWWLSRTILANLAVATLLLVEANLQLLDGLLPVPLYKIAAFGLPVLNLWLRAITTGAVTLRAPRGALPSEVQP